MLELLKIENLALMRKAEVEFFDGFTAVTGETGAGKSVMLGALSLLAGNRSGKEIVGRESDSCRIEATLNFPDSSKIDSFLEESGLPPCEENTLVLCRIVSKSKPGRAFINGSPAPLSVLAELGKLWIDFHGSNEPQKLFSAREQLLLLDSFAKNSPDKSRYLELMKKRSEILSEIDRLKNSEKLSSDEAEFLKGKIARIDSLNPTDERVAEIERLGELASKSEEISERASEICRILSGEGGVSDLTGRANRIASELALSGGDAKSLAERLVSASVEISDIADCFERLASECDMSPEEISRASGELSDWLELSRKYGGSPAMVRRARDDMARRIELQSDVDLSVEKLSAEAGEILKKIAPVARKIFESRESAAKKLSSDTEKLLEALGFKKARFSAKVSEISEVSRDCGSVVEFLFSANAGQPLLPLSKIASGGELARVMLAIKTELASCDDTPLLVFDEVDANVGGEIGAKIGLELSKLGKGRQVLCITHLPQVAAKAKNHLLVEKSQTDSSTSVKISALDGEERVGELARMLGDRNSDSAVSHARKLLSWGEK